MASQLAHPPVTRRVVIHGMVLRTTVTLTAIMAPADPEVGLFAPYPLALEVKDAEGLVVPISRAERLVFLGALQSAYHALEAA